MGAVLRSRYRIAWQFAHVQPDGVPSVRINQRVIRAATGDQILVPIVLIGDERLVGTSRVHYETTPTTMNDRVDER